MQQKSRIKNRIESNQSPPEYYDFFFKKKKEKKRKEKKRKKEKRRHQRSSNLRFVWVPTSEHLSPSSVAVLRSANVILALLVDEPSQSNQTRRCDHSNRDPCFLASIHP
ncbi:LOW QUALITY PROTEIN: hypothetical protein PanWU01x14_031350 [Parasponia andersonii]|uniref:Uncharacterized protein n=1 Tax=Parasponia andersonii TaxID=3476 RepID=A0A2P5DU57_PARAD|nr:LOW QUALITY PROTEIN: hypothetical protein PanWU01x14_031350 [Parasponia andersonii]